MSSRKARRAAAHQTRKLARQAEKLPTPPPVEAPELLLEETVRTPSPAQIDANRANAQFSTGPRTPEGKAISSQNRLSHGLAGQFAVAPWENLDEYHALVQELLDHYYPVGPVERGYVEHLCQHSWLRLRALDLQLTCFAGDEPSELVDPKQFALFARYETQHERAMDRCVNMLAKLQKERRQEQIGFESQIRQEAAETRQKEAHDVKMRMQNARLKVIEAHPALREAAPTPPPAPISIPIEPVSISLEPGIEEIQQTEVAA